MSTLSLRVMTLSALCAASVPALAQQQKAAAAPKKPRQVAERVIGFRPAAEPKTHNGACPATVKFLSFVKVNHAPATVVYQWERSDGATGPKQTITIAGNTQYVRDTWQLGGPGERLTIWERVHVLSPNDITSGRAMAHVNCSKG